MFMLRLRTGFFVVLWSVVHVAPAAAQDFTEGIVLYNRAAYDSLIRVYAPAFLKTHPQEEGLVRYFLGESFYNKALASSTPAQMKTLLTAAKREFERARRSADLRLTFQQYDDYAQYKIGWCHYRLAELSERPGPELDQAYRQFIACAPDAADSLKIFSYMMAMDCSIKRSQLLSYTSDGTVDDPSAWRRVLANLGAAEEHANAVLAFRPSASTPLNLNELKAAVRLRKEMLSYYRGRAFQVMGDEAFRLLDATAAGNVTRATSALAAFASADYASALTGEAFGQGRGTLLAYFDLMRGLNQYAMTGSVVGKRNILSDIGRLWNTDLHAEAVFRRANLAQSHPDIDSDEFNELAVTFYDSARAIPESDYWAGVMLMTLNQPQRSRARLTAFIQKTHASGNRHPRTHILVEDARYRRFLLDFERYYLSNRMRDIRRLAAEMRVFTPQNPGVAQRREQLNLLINCSLSTNTQQIWAGVLHGTDNEKLAQALRTVRFVLPRAAVQIGEKREKLIVLINRLLAVTEVRRSDETRFYRGIARSLQAEIEATPMEKTAAFEGAARMLQPIQDQFANKAEAEYVRGRSLFFAAEFQAAAEIFRRLVKQQRSLRALFYLAEIFRSEGNGAAAKACYRAVLQKLQSRHLEDFWVQNARAGLASSGEGGDVSVLEGLPYEAVSLRSDSRSELLTYEQLAEERYLKQAEVAQVLDWLVRFGLPQKDVYPSVHALAKSHVLAENHFTAFPGRLDEVRYPVSASLHLTVLLPAGVPPEATVTLEGDTLSRRGDVFVRTGLPLKSTKQITIHNPGCDARVIEQTFASPGANERTVALSRALAYTQSGRPRNLVDDFAYRLPTRPDLNYLMQRLPELDPESDLMRDFRRSIRLRDCAWDSLRNRLLVLDAQENGIWIYSDEEQSRRMGRLALPADVRLNSPEGIAVDAQGRIYIADWGNHRIVILNPDGAFVRQLGQLGANANPGTQVKFTFPTRLALVEDAVGIRYGEQRVYAPTYLYVADFHGVHKITLGGTYVSTLIGAAKAADKGRFYGLAVDGYGKDSRLFLVNRLAQPSGSVQTFVGR